MFLISVLDIQNEIPTLKSKEMFLLLQMALRDDSGPKGDVYTTYSDISNMRFGIVIAAAFSPTASYMLTPEHSGLGADVSLQ